MTSRNQIQDLRPGTNYQIQARAVSGGYYSEWSRVFDFTTIKDEMPPEDVQNVTWVSSGDSFHAEWDPITQNINLEDIIVDHYDLELTNTANVPMVVTVPQGSSRLSYDLSFEANRALWTTPQATVKLRVRAVDNKGLQSNWTAPITATNTPPNPVTALNITAVTDGIYLKWTAPADTDILGYNLYIGAATNPTSRFNSKPITTTEYNYATLTYSKQYFKVTVVDKFGQESTGVEVNATPNSPFTADTTAPSTPTSLAATITNNSNGIGARVAVSWTMSSPPTDLAGFYIRYRRVGDTNYSMATFTNADRAGTINLDAAFTNYEFQIKAFDWSNNESAWSSTVTVTSPANPAPANVTGLTGVAGRDSIVYSWTATADKDIANYEVTFSTSSTFASGNITYKTGTSTTLTISGLTPGTTYYARVRAVDNSGLTSIAWSTINTTTTDAQLTASDVGADAAGAATAAQIAAIAAASTDATTKSAAARTGAVGDIKTLWGASADTTKIDGGKIFTNSILATSIALGDWNNYVPNFGFENADLRAAYPLGSGQSYTNDVESYGGMGYSVKCGPTGGAVITPIAEKIPVSPGDSFYISWYQKRVGAVDFDASPNIRILQSNGSVADGQTNLQPTLPPRTVADGQWVFYEGLVTIAGTTAAFALPNIRTFEAGTTGAWYVDNIILRRADRGQMIVDGTIQANKITAGTYTGGNFVVGSGGVIQSSDYAAGSLGFKLSNTALEINKGSIKASALIGDTLTSTTGTINIGAGAIIQTNGGAIKSNTFNGTFTGGVYNNNATAGYYLDSTNGIIVKTGKVYADALEAGTISGTKTITLSGANAKIVGGSWSLSGSGLSIPNGGIQAAALNISGSAVNLIPGEYSSFELNPSFYSTDVSAYPMSGTFNTTYLSNIPVYGNVLSPHGWFKGEGATNAYLTVETLLDTPNKTNAVAIPPGVNLFADPYLRTASWSSGIGGYVTNLPASLGLPYDARAWTLDRRDHVVTDTSLKIAVSPGGTYQIFAKLKRLSGTLDVNASFWYADGTAYDGVGEGNTPFKAISEVNEDGWYLAMASVVVPTGHSAPSSVYFQINQGTPWETSFLITDISYFAVGSGSNAMAQSNNFPVVAGDSYTVTFKALAPAGTGTHYFRIQDAATTNHSDFEAGVSNSSLADEWQSYSFTWVAPTGYTWASLRFYNYGSSSGYLYVTDVSIVNDTTGEFTPNNISSVGTNSPKSVGYATVMNENYMNGKQSIKIVLDNISAANGYVEVHGNSPIIPVEPNETYIVSAYVYQADGALNDSWIRMQIDGSASGSNSITTTNTNISAINMWKRVSWVFTTGATQTYVKLWPSIGTNAAVSGRIYYIDGIMLEQQLSNSTSPSTYTSGGYTQISGGMIVTGSMHSTAPAIDGDGNIVPDSWAWSFDTQGNATLGNAQINGNLIVGSTQAGTNSIVQSAAFVPAQLDSNGNPDPSTGSGWRINSDGSAEFYKVKSLNLDANALSVKSISPSAINDGEFAAVVNLTGGIEIDSTDSNGILTQRLGMSAARGFYSEKINGDGSITPYILFPVNGAPNIISGQLHTDDFSIGEANDTGTGKVYGNMSMMSGSLLSLNNSVDAPSAPVVTQTWDYTQTANYGNGATDVNGKHVQFFGLTYVDPNTYACFYRIQYTSSSGYYNITVRPVAGQAYPTQLNDNYMNNWYGIAILNASDLSLKGGNAGLHSLGSYQIKYSQDAHMSDGSYQTTNYSNYSLIPNGLTYSPSNGYVLSYSFGQGATAYLECYNTSFGRTSQIPLDTTNSTSFLWGGAQSAVALTTVNTDSQFYGGLNEVIFTSTYNTVMRMARVNFSSAGVINTTTPLVNMPWAATSGGWTVAGGSYSSSAANGVLSAGKFDIGRDVIITYDYGRQYYHCVDSTTGALLSSQTGGGAGAQGWPVAFGEQAWAGDYDRNLRQFRTISANGKWAKYQNGTAYSKTAQEGQFVNINVTYTRTVSNGSGGNITYETVPSSPGQAYWHNRGLYTVSIQQIPYNVGDPNSPDRANIYAWGAIGGSDVNNMKLLSQIIQPGTTLSFGNTSFALTDSPHPLAFPGASISQITGANGLAITSAGDITTNRFFPQQWVGAVQMFAGNTPPDGWMVCDGRTLNRTTYAFLYAALGGISSPWGQGDGSTTFNIPNLKGRVVVGVGQASANGATNHTLGQMGGEEKHALTTGEQMGLVAGPPGSGWQFIGAGGTAAAPHNNMQPYAGMNYVIYTGVHS